MSDMNKYEIFLGHLEHELEKGDVIIEKFKELFSEELLNIKSKSVHNANSEEANK